MSLMSTVISKAEADEALIVGRFTVRTDPRGNVRPHLGVRLTSDQDPEVLQADADLARIFDDAGVACRHCVYKWPDRVESSDIVRRVDNCKRGHRHTLRTDQGAVNRQSALAKKVLAIEPLDG